MTASVSLRFLSAEDDCIFPFVKGGMVDFTFPFCFAFMEKIQNESTKFVYSFFEQIIMSNSKTLILSNRQIQQRIDRIAYQIYENNYQEKEIIVAGISKNGYTLAERISEKLMEISPIKVKLAEVTMNKKEPLSGKVKVNLPEKELKAKVVIVVDDVLESGRTMIYGIDPFLKSSVRRLTTVVLVDRAHHSYPIKADFVGISLATTMQEHISVELNGAKNDAVYLM